MEGNGRTNAPDDPVLQAANLINELQSSGFVLPKEILQVQELLTNSRKISRQNVNAKRVVQEGKKSDAIVASYTQRLQEQNDILKEVRWSYESCFFRALNKIIIGCRSIRNLGQTTRHYEYHLANITPSYYGIITLKSEFTMHYRFNEFD